MLQRKCLRGWGMVKCQGAWRGYRTRGSKLIRLRTVKHESHDTNARANTTLDHQLANLSHFGPGFDDKHQLRKCPHELCHAAHSQPKGIFGVGCIFENRKLQAFRPFSCSISHPSLSATQLSQVHQEPLQSQEAQGAQHRKRAARTSVTVYFICFISLCLKLCREF